MKRCSVCRLTKSLDEFHVWRRSPDGRKAQCKACNRAAAQQWYRSNSERAVGNAKAWKRAHRERDAQHCRRYRESEKGRRSAEGRRESKRARDRAYYAANADAFKQRARERQAKIRGADVEKFSRLAVFDRDGWRCQLCYEPIDSEIAYPDPMSASIDHVHPLSLGGAHTLSNVQAAHLTCNRQKGGRLVAAS